MYGSIEDAMLYNTAHLERNKYLEEHSGASLE
jgi:hypothetical protein